jgi:5-methylcytosine-specific restriction enzyme subunit McrC
MNELSIREFGYIIQKGAIQHASGNFTTASSELDFKKDVCELNQKAWEYLEHYAYSGDKENRFIRFRTYNGKKALQVVNFVGVITLPDDIHLEILPKTSQFGQDANVCRKQLVKMLCEVDDLPFIENNEADLVLFNQPLQETLISWFLRDLTNVVRKGIRKDYERVEAEERFLKGRLLVSQQINQPVSRQHLFRIAYDVFSDNRAENRLIHSALVQVAKWCKSENNQKLARELRFAFNEFLYRQTINLILASGEIAEI